MKRFWDKVDITTQCWNWIGSCKPTGYGQFGLGKKIVYAHRVAYEMVFGPIPKNRHVCHKCDNRRCVNPSHLFLGTDQDNLDDMSRKGRNSRKINIPIAKQIREAKGSQRDVAKRFGVSQRLVWNIKHNKIWKFV